VHQFSFAFNDPTFEVKGWKISFQVITFENVYGLDPEQATLAERHPGKWAVTSQRMMWAGNQEKAAGQAAAELESIPEGLDITFSASLVEKIRCSKVILRGLPKSTLIGSSWKESEIGEGVVLEYPPRISAMTDPRLHTPLVFLRLPDGEYLFFRSLDARVRQKRFAVYPSPFGDGVTVELIHEDLGPEMTSTTVVPRWRIGRTRNPDAVVEEHRRHVESCFGLVEWSKNPLIPQWVKEISLVAYIHGQHWTGYVFNDYRRMMEILDALSRRLPGKRILAHLAGWEGRYYWKYGDFTPDDRMGGPEGFRRLCCAAHERGIHVQVMLGANCANVCTDGFQQWGDPSWLRTAGGARESGNSPDWDTSRSHDAPWQAWLNPGAPGWQMRLLEQSAHLIETYRVDGIFLDTHGNWHNDPGFPVYDGLLSLRDQLRRSYPNVLLSGEDWWDALGGITPLSHADWMLLDRWKDFFSRYNRTYGHNAWGDPSRGSSGVFEGGWREFQMVPDVFYAIPTLPVVDGTLEKAPEKVERVLEQARRYAREYLGEAK
jgi:hypothetical protein